MASPLKSKVGREQSIVELQKRFDEISALIEKTLAQVEEMKILQIKIEAEREKIKITPKTSN